MAETDRFPGQMVACGWDGLGEDNPGEAANMRLRSGFVSAVRQAVTGWGLTQSMAAKRLKVSQPRLNDLLRGRINNFSLDTLILLAARAGLNVRVQIERSIRAAPFIDPPPPQTSRKT